MNRHCFFAIPSFISLRTRAARQGLVCREPDRALAGIVVLKFVLHGLYYGTGVEGAVVRSGTVGRKQLPVQAKSGQLVTDALFGLRRHGLDALPKRLERGSLVRTHGPRGKRRCSWVYLMLLSASLRLAFICLHHLH